MALKSLIINRLGNVFLVVILVGSGKTMVREMYGESLVFRIYMMAMIPVVVAAVMMGLKECAKAINGQE